MALSLYNIDNFSESHRSDFLEYIRDTRNSCRHRMTRNQDLITKEEQISWYKGLDDNTQVFILIVSEHGVAFFPCGYGLIRYKDDVAILTGAIEESSRGKGCGRELFKLLVEEAQKITDKVTLEVFESNVEAFNLYKSLGFEIIDKDDDIVFMELVK